MIKNILNISTATLLMSISIHSHIYSADVNTIATNKNLTNSLSLDLSTPLSEKLLDEIWSKREDVDNQKKIADYLITKPTIPNNYAIAWKVARLICFIGNYGYGKPIFVGKYGAKFFQYGIEAGEVATKVNSEGKEGLYWKAVDMGSYGLAAGVLASAMKAGPGMKALQKVHDLDITYDGYGSSRILGRYYQELPFIFGGSMSKAEKLLKEATDSNPKFRNNWVFLGQFYLAKKNKPLAKAACEKVLTLPETEGKYEEMRYTEEANICIAKASS